MSDGWIATLVIAFVLAMFSPLLITEHGHNQCRIEAIKAGIEADKINTACGIK